MRRIAHAAAAALLAAALAPGTAHAFCGFFVAKADAKLFNQASQVALVRDGDKTVLTMANDFQGDPKEFAIVIPVPELLARGQIHVGDRALLDHLDAYSAPRLVEVYDPDPCMRVLYETAMPMMAAPGGVVGGMAAAPKLGVHIEATYTVGEYDIIILSAEQSDGLATWLTENGYRLPPGAAPVLDGYLKQGMHFFVAKVNVKEQEKLGFNSLRPIQVAYRSPKFMLPIRLGMVNARLDQPAQELFVYALTRRGRVETTDYRTTRLPSDVDVPLFVKAEFGDFYKSMFKHQVAKDDMRSVFLEYAWDMSWCDPCAADPLSTDELRQLGVFWLGESSPADASGSREVFLTRLHVRYDAAHFPEDLVFQETADNASFQGRYILRHPWKGSGSCPAAADYRRGLRQRQAKDARTLASLTGWDLDRVRGKMNLPARAAKPPADDSWWTKLWKR